MAQTYVPAGIDASKGALSLSVFVDPTDTASQSDPDVQAYFAWMDKYYPSGDKFDGLNAAAYVYGQLVIDVLKRCGDSLTRQYHQAVGEFSSVQSPMLQPGITVNTSRDDYNMFKTLQMMIFDGKHLVPIGN